MNKHVIALVMILGLVGCGPTDSEKAAEAAEAAQEQAQLELIATEEAAKQELAEKKELADIIEELKKGDPLVQDAYFGFNEKGDRVLHIIRANPPQEQQTSQGTMIVAAPQVSESVWPMAAGLGAGMLLASAINSGGGYSNYSNYHRPYSYNSYSDSDYRRNRTTVVNNYHTTVVNKTKTVVNNTPKYREQAKVAATSKVQFGQAKPYVKPSTSSSYAPGTLPAKQSNPVTTTSKIQPAARAPQINARVVQKSTPPPAYKAPATTYKAPTSRPSTPSRSYSSSSTRK